MKNCIKITLLCSMLVLGLSSAVYAGGEDILKSALTEYDDVLNKYNKMKGENDKADEGKKITREQYDELKKGIDKALDLFDQYQRVGTDYDAKKACNHYTFVLEYYLFSFKNDLKEYRDNFSRISTIEDKLATLKGYSYPINYSNDGKNYIIKEETRTNTEKNLMVEIVECCTNYGKSAETVKYAKKAYTFYSLGDYNLWWCAHLWYFHAVNKLYYTGVDAVEPAENVIYAMSGLKRSDIKKIKDSNWVNYTHAYYKLNELLKANPSLSRNGQVWANAGEAFEKLEEDVWANEYYEKALKAGYGDKDFLVKMMNRGKNKNDKELVKTAAGIYDSKNLYSTYTCADYDMMAGFYRYTGDVTKANDLEDKYEKCVKEQNKQQRRAERGAKFFLSFAPLPLLSGNLQGSIQLGSNKRLHEFGIRQINEQKDYGYDMTGQNKNPKNMIWSGMAYYYTYKKFMRGYGKEKNYFGFQFRYTDKKYEDQTATVTNANTGAYVGSYVFSPNEKRYDFTFQFGNMYTSKFAHFEFYGGFGAGFTTFDGGRTEWNNGAYKITDNTFLSNRKETRFGLTLRMGLMIGLNLVNR